MKAGEQGGGEKREGQAALKDKRFVQGHTDRDKGGEEVVGNPEGAVPREEAVRGARAETRARQAAQQAGSVMSEAVEEEGGRQRDHAAEGC